MALNQSLIYFILFYFILRRRRSSQTILSIQVFTRHLIFFHANILYSLLFLSSSHMVKVYVQWWKKSTDQIMYNRTKEAFVLESHNRTQYISARSPSPYQVISHDYPHSASINNNNKSICFFTYDENARSAITKHVLYQLHFPISAITTW
jgi:hypothetical protein